MRFDSCTEMNRGAMCMQEIYIHVHNVHESFCRLLNDTDELPQSKIESNGDMRNRKGRVECFSLKGS